MTGFVQQTTETSGINTSHDQPLIVGTNQGLFLFFQSEQRVELEGRCITAIAPSPSGLWVVVDHKSVWYRDERDQWQVVASSVQDLQLNCIVPLNGKVFVGTTEAHLLAIAKGSIELVDSFDLAPGRDEWYTPWGGPPDVRSLAVGQRGELYANVHVGVKFAQKMADKSGSPLSICIRMSIKC